ncbi:hypothetical protein GH714_014503 [Hevea brasiliensis]|uniref:Helicase C-terminal domain-containing protein n=1 Tax=Hevea brasiliensis TaxID=3981 RepID=A0A6A6MZF1_HEVBR|nr:hypothetical protein GH714_014503 [Hevea brasiliensis]
MVTNCPSLLSSNGEQLHEKFEKASKIHSIENCDINAVKRRKVSGEHDSYCTVDAGNTIVLSKNSLNGEQGVDGTSDVSSMSFSDGLLRTTCEELKQKYLSMFTAKLSMAQQDFRKSYKQFPSMTALKYHIQTRLDQLEASRKTLLDRLLEIDQTMEKPKEEDIERVRYCQVARLLVMVPHDYEARLFRLNKLHGEIITSAEEAVDLQKKNSALNRFYWNLSWPNKNPTSSGDVNETSKRRDAGERVVVSKSPSELEVVLGVIKSYCKVQLGKEGITAASKQLHNLEEYSHARSLAVSQAQLLRAHDEIRMATSRLHLRENENDDSIDALGPNELESASVLHSNEKFISLSMLSPTTAEMSASIKGGWEPLRIWYGLFAMTEQRQHDNKFQRKWVMCPTCRQHTDFGNIAYADDRQDKSCNSAMLNAVQDCEKCEASLTVQGSYGSKIEAVTRRILWIKSSDPDAKVLVFSSWNDVLDVLEHAFNANGITYIRMKGGRKAHIAISEFRGQESSAKRTHKIHGQKEQKAEAQAISRVHRIGQENKTLVHRFIVKSTVEESIYKLNRSKNTSSFISGNTKNQDQPLLTLEDVESLFATVASTVPKGEEETTESLRHLPPAVAAALAAERRLKENTT